MTSVSTFHYRPFVVDYSQDDRLLAMCTLGQDDNEAIYKFLKESTQDFKFSLVVYNKLFYNSECIELYLQKTLTTSQEKVKYFITMCTTKYDNESQFISKSFKSESSYYQVNGNNFIKGLFISLTDVEFVNVINGMGSSYLYINNNTEHKSDFDDLIFSHPCSRDENSYKNADVSMILEAVRHGNIDLVESRLQQTINIKYLGNVTVPLYVQVLFESNTKLPELFMKDVEKLYNTEFSINGFTLLHIAIIEQNQSLFDNMLKFNKNNSEFINRCDRFGNTPLMCALMNSVDPEKFILPLLELDNISLVHQSNVTCTPYLLYSEYTKLTNYKSDYFRSTVSDIIPPSERINTRIDVGKPGNDAYIAINNMFAPPSNSDLDKQYLPMYQPLEKKKIVSTVDTIKFKNSQLASKFLEAFKKSLKFILFSYDAKLLMLIINSNNQSTELFSSVVNTTLQRDVLGDVLKNVESKKNDIKLNDCKNPYDFYQNYYYYCDIISIIQNKLKPSGWFM